MPHSLPELSKLQRFVRGLGVFVAAFAPLILCYLSMKNAILSSLAPGVTAFLFSLLHVIVGYSNVPVFNFAILYMYMSCIQLMAIHETKGWRDTAGQFIVCSFLLALFMSVCYVRVANRMDWSKVDRIFTIFEIWLPWIVFFVFPLMMLFFVVHPDLKLETYFRIIRGQKIGDIELGGLLKDSRKPEVDSNSKTTIEMEDLLA